ncbi:MAG: methylthioribulose 1-phosphate dehydratase [Acidobacteriota bacterium]
MARARPSQIASLVEIGRRFYARGWVLGTSGNFSVVSSRQPLRLAITASSVHKGRLRASDFLLCDDRGIPSGRALSSPGAARGRVPQCKPSAETLLHLEIVRRRQAGAVLHTHSAWATVLSHLHGDAGGFSIEGYEMLKGLNGVSSHEHREWIPIVDNDQDMPRLAQRVGALLDQQPEAHAFLLRRHGLYTWGATIADAERHVEILEFLFETVGLNLQLSISGR